MNWLLAIPLEARLIFLFVAGAFLGGLANLATYRLAWHACWISPWSRPDPRLLELKIPPRRMFDRVPIWGWLGLAREAPLHGRGFWIRPMLVELACAFGLAWLYCWEIDQKALLPAMVPIAMPANIMTILHVQFAVHTLVIWLMLAASLIDADEKTIPDAITVPGTLFALLMAAIYPFSLLPVATMPINVMGGVLSFVTVTAPDESLPWVVGQPTTAELLIALGCWWLACFALMRRDWYTRHGWGRAFVILCARLRREASTWWLCGLGLIGSVAIVSVWAFCGIGWTGLFTALSGMAVSAGMVWAIRILASAALRREAMGFGDVTLMAMLGAFLGWQACLMVFFLATILALVVGLVVLAIQRDHEIPFGPFLCMAALIIIIRWSSIWAWAEERFALGLVIPAMILGCLVLLPILLGVWMGIRTVVERFFMSRSNG